MQDRRGRFVNRCRSVEQFRSVVKTEHHRAVVLAATFRTSFHKFLFRQAELSQNFLKARFGSERVPVWLGFEPQDVRNVWAEGKCLLQGIQRLLFVACSELAYGECVWIGLAAVCLSVQDLAFDPLLPKTFATRGVVSSLELRDLFVDLIL